MQEARKITTLIVRKIKNASETTHSVIRPLDLGIFIKIIFFITFQMMFKEKCKKLEK